MVVMVYGMLEGLEWDPFLNKSRLEKTDTIRKEVDIVKGSLVVSAVVE